MTHPVKTNPAASHQDARRSEPAAESYWEDYWFDHDLDSIGQVSPQHSLYKCLRRVIAEEALGRPLWVLEAGCGVGRALFEIARDASVARAVGVDCTTSVRLAQAYKERHAVEKVKVLQGDVFSLPFQSETFNMVTSLGVVEHFLDPVTPLKEMGRVLKPGGVLFLETPNRSLFVLRRKLFPISERMVFYRPEELNQFAVEAGFRPLQAFGLDFGYSVKQTLTPPAGREGLLHQAWRIAVAALTEVCRLADPWLHRYGFFSCVVARKPSLES